MKTGRWRVRDNKKTRGYDYGKPNYTLPENVGVFEPWVNHTGLTYDRGELIESFVATHKIKDCIDVHLYYQGKQYVHDIVLLEKDDEEEKGRKINRAIDCVSRTIDKLLEGTYPHKGENE